MQVGATLRGTAVDLLRIGLDQAAASIRYRGQRRRNSGPCHASPTVPGTGKQAANPPVRQLDEPLLIDLPVLDGSHLGRWPELTPAHAPVVAIDEHLVDGAVRHMSALGLAVARHRAVLRDALGMKADAPATTPDTVVRLDQRSEVSPGIGREQPSRVHAVRYFQRKCTKRRPKFLESFSTR